MTKYTEIYKLVDMLDKAEIKYKFLEYPERDGFAYEHYHLQVFNPNTQERIISVIEGDRSFGGNKNLLEIMGCLTPEEAEHDCVKGYLTAEEVFNRINNALKQEAQNG